MPTYYTHDNGGMPYKVVIKDGILAVHKHLEGGMNTPAPEKEYTEKPILRIKPTRIFVGKSPLTLMTKTSGGHGPAFNGNSILAQIKPLTYIYIGQNIQQIKTKEEVTSYISPVGNNDVPYPYAKTAKNVYLMLEHVCIPRASLAPECRDDPYLQLYDYDEKYKSLIPPGGYDLLSACTLDKSWIEERRETHAKKKASTKAARESAKKPLAKKALVKKA